MFPRRPPAGPPEAFGVARKHERARPVRGPLSWADALPAVLIVISLCVQAATPPEITGAPLLAAAPFVAAYRMTLRATVLIGALVLAIGAVEVLATAGPTVPHGFVDLGELAVLVVVSLGLCRVRRRRDAELATAQVVAETVRQAVLPPLPARCGPLEVAGRYEPAYAAARIGGDLYAVARTRYGVRVLVADVRGKGLGAMSAVAATLGAFREAAPRAPDLPALVGWLDESDQRWKRQLGDAGALEADERFITALCAEVSLDGRRLRTLQCGHPAPLLLRDGEAPRTLHPAAEGLPLGLRDLAPSGNSGTPPVREDALAPGDTLLLFTDGVVEARDRARVFFDPVAFCTGLGAPSPRATVDALADAVLRHSEGVLEDDMAVLALSLPRE
ncbi:PP2C family protein-serine/threonine phosphatase [Streptomyces sp. NPDC054796]